MNVRLHGWLLSAAMVVFLLPLYGCGSTRDDGMYLGAPPHLLEKVLHEARSTKHETRKGAMILLGVFVPTRETVEALLVGMEDPHSEVRLYAALSLGKIATFDKLASVKVTSNDLPARPTIVRALMRALSDTASNVRGQACSSLAEYDGEAKIAVRLLIQRLKNDGEQEVRREAYWALKRIDPKVLQADDPELRQAVSDLSRELQD